MIPQTAAQAQAIMLIVAAALAVLVAVLGVLRHLLGANWWRFRRRNPATADEQDQA